MNTIYSPGQLTSIMKRINKNLAYCAKILLLRTHIYEGSTTLTYVRICDDKFKKPSKNKAKLILYENRKNIHEKKNEKFVWMVTYYIHTF